VTAANEAVPLEPTPERQALLDTRFRWRILQELQVLRRFGVTEPAEIDTLYAQVSPWILKQVLAKGMNPLDKSEALADRVLLAIRQLVPVLEKNLAATPADGQVEPKSKDG